MMAECDIMRDNVNRPSWPSCFANTYRMKVRVISIEIAPAGQHSTASGDYIAPARTLASSYAADDIITKKWLHAIAIIIAMPPYMLSVDIARRRFRQMRHRALIELAALDIASRRSIAHARN